MDSPATPEYYKPVGMDDDVAPPPRFDPNPVFPPPLSSTSNTPPHGELTGGGYYSNPSQSLEEKLLAECCLSYDALCFVCNEQRTRDPVIHLRTRGRDNILSDKPRVYKHQLLKNPKIRAQIIDHYKRLNYAWVDIVVLNRHYWSIFLFSQDP